MDITNAVKQIIYKEIIVVCVVCPKSLYMSKNMPDMYYELPIRPSKIGIVGETW